MNELTNDELASVARRMTDAGARLAGRLSASPTVGGRSNLTYRLSDEVSNWVLRMPPRAGRTPSAHDVAREHRVTSALAATGVPVPPAVLLCDDDSVLGGPFTVTGFVPGATIRTRDQLSELDDLTVGRAVSALTLTLAALHQVDHEKVGLGSFGRPDAYAARQIRRWTGQWELVGRGAPAVRYAAKELSSRLSATTPPQRSTGVVHGDYRIDNALLRFGDDGAVDVAAVVDWELSTIGDPVADVALMCTYRNPALDLILGERTAWTSDRLPSSDALAAGYERAGGVPLEYWDFHLALAHFKLAVIAAGIDYRHRAGATEGGGFASAGYAVEPLLAAGLTALSASSSA